jgi:hypothetical protein
MSKLTKTEVADELRRFLNRRRREYSRSVGVFKRALEGDDPADAMVHSREAIVEGVRLGVADLALGYFDAAHTEAVQKKGTGLLDEEDAAATVEGFDRMYKELRIRFIRLARELSQERDAHRLIVLGARVATLAEIIENSEDLLAAMEQK